MPARTPSRATSRTTSGPAEHAADKGPLSVRGWLVIAGGVLSGAVILVAWLPLGALLGQRAALSSTEARLAQLSREATVLNGVLARLHSSAAREQFGLADYQLVSPGQRLIQVLTPSFTPSSRSSSGPYPGDPGFAALVDPSGAGLVGVTPTGTSATSATAGTRGANAAAPAPGFVSRVVSTLEFWR